MNSIAMSRKFLESDEVDSKIFAGRVLTLLGEILREQVSLKKFLEEKFFVPSEYNGEDLYDGSEEGTEDGEHD